MLISRMFVRSLVAGAILAIVILPFCGGCGPGGFSGPTGTVSGTVTLNGEPVPSGCSVAFVSDDGHAASGTVGAGGKYELSVAGEGNNVPAATYKVMISPPSAGEVSDADYDEMMEEESAGAGGEAEAKTQSEKEVIPAKYQSTGTSELSFEVKAGSNTIPISLE